MAIDQVSIYTWQTVINDNIYPISQTPELEMENSCVFVWSVRVPLLSLPVWNNLKNITYFVQNIIDKWDSFGLRHAFILNKRPEKYLDYRILPANVFFTIPFSRGLHEEPDMNRQPQTSSSPAVLGVSRDG